MWSALSDLPPPPDLSAASGLRQQKSPIDTTNPIATASTTNPTTTASTTNPTTTASMTNTITESPTFVDWDAFSQRRLLVAFSRGAAVLPGYPNAAAQDSTGRRVVNMELWNTYWSAFSDRFADHIDAVQEQIAAQSGPRRVLIAASLTDEPAIEHFKDQLTRHAREFGALEYIARERVVVILQFTCARAAEAFSAWASSLTLAEFQGFNGVTDESGRLFVRLVAPDTSRTTSTVRLGKSIVLSTAFVEGVFEGIFDAAQVMYEPVLGSFLISFDSNASATIAVHSLQRSLIDVFGLSLLFLNETQPLHQ